ncbi:hypothetical protein AB0A91_16265 [Streptomyces sp. NPDC042207]|uniref:hypothetical protein n=1 Tax=Streptomyces sp. NPDC042207 TaxID=3154331 RepID=UPI0033C2781F
MNGFRIGAGERERIYASTTDTYDEAADLDLIAIEYALNGEPVVLTTDERVYAARLLDARGLDAGAIAHRIGTAASTVRGWKANGWKRGGASKVAPPRSEPKCGEQRMYRRHLRRGESCDVCRAANSAADRRYRLTGSTKASA